MQPWLQRGQRETKLGSKCCSKVTALHRNTAAASEQKVTYLKGLSMEVAVTLKCLYLRAFILSLVVIPRAAIYETSEQRRSAATAAQSDCTDLTA